MALIVDQCQIFGQTDLHFFTRVNWIYCFKIHSIISCTFLQGGCFVETSDFESDISKTFHRGKRILRCANVQYYGPYNDYLKSKKEHFFLHVILVETALPFVRVLQNPRAAGRADSRPWQARPWPRSAVERQPAAWWQPTACWRLATCWRPAAACMN